MTARQTPETLLFELMQSIVKNEGVECEQYPEMFFPEDYSNSARNSWDVVFAKGVCAQCPLINQCFEYAMESDQQFGIWGGLTTWERNKLKGRDSKPFWGRSIPSRAN